MKKLLLLFAAILMASTTLCATLVGDQFVDETSHLKFEVTSLDPKTVKVIANDYDGQSFTIPATVRYLEDDYAVTAIGENAFAGVGSQSDPADLLLPADWEGSKPEATATLWYGGYFVDFRAIANANIEDIEEKIQVLSEQIDYFAKKFKNLEIVQKAIESSKKNLDAARTITTNIKTANDKETIIIDIDLVYELQEKIQGELEKIRDVIKYFKINVKNDVNSAADDATSKIDAYAVADEVKKSAIDEIVIAVEEAEQAIEDADSEESVNSAKNKAIGEIDIQLAKVKDYFDQLQDALDAVDKAVAEAAMTTTLTTEEYQSIEDYKTAIKAATTEEDIIANKEAALAIIDLRLFKDEAIATLNNLVKDMVGVDISSYTTAINGATSKERITEILNNATEEISNSFTVGDKTYYLNHIGPDYTFYGNITFKDKELYQSDYDFTVTGKLEYTRTFKATGVWQAWFVPFEVTVSDMKKAGMEVAEIAGVLMDEKEPYIAFAKMTNTDAIVKANTPYVVKTTKSSVSMTLTGPDICIRKSTDAELEAQRLTVQSSYNTFTFGGNYQQTNGYANKWYALNTSGVFQKMGDGANLEPQRFWMKIDTRTDTPYHTGSSATAKAFIGMTVLGDDDTTGIESLTPSLSKGKGTIYNLQGQKVTSIRKGQVYIVDGKHFMAR